MNELCLQSRSRRPGCSKTDEPNQNFTPKPECMGESVITLSGTSPQVISQLSIGTAADGFDLNGDGMPDNKLSAVSSLAMSSIMDAFAELRGRDPDRVLQLPDAGP